VASGDHVFMSLDAEVSAVDSLGSAVTSDGRDAHMYDGGGWNAGEREQTWGDVGIGTMHECSKAAPHAPRELQLLGVFGYGYERRHACVR
jgi:glycogen debranching enzyme